MFDVFLKAVLVKIDFLVVSLSNKFKVGKSIEELSEPNLTVPVVALESLLSNLGSNQS